MINLYDILEAADGQLFGEPAAQIFADFCFDARQAKAGELFVAMKTDRGDGHHFMLDAIRGGVTGIMCTYPPTFDTDGLTVIVMRSVEDALMSWTRLILRKFGTTVIAVTGSVGKSITAAAIAQVLGARHKAYTQPGQLEGRFGLPLALGRLAKDHRFAVLELGVNQPGEMITMVEAVKPLVGVVTAISHAHTDRFASLEAIAEEKSELVRRLPPEGVAVLNFDDSLARGLAASIPASVITVGLDINEPAFGSDLLAYNILMDRYKTGFDLRHRQARYAGRWVPLLGAHQLYGVLAALAVGLSFDIPLEEGLQALTRIEPLPGRMRPLAGPGGSLIIDDTVCAIPESTRAALRWLDSVRGDESRAIFAFGDMDHLGTYSSLAHIQAGQQAAKAADVFVTKGDLAAEAGRVALESGLARDRVHVTFSAEDAANAIRAGLGPDDLVLIQGGPSARMERVVRHLLADEEAGKLLARQTDNNGEPDVLEGSPHLSGIHIDMEAIAYNVRRLKAIIGPDVTLLAVVQADAYGHGAVPVSTTALNNGAGFLGVGTLAEALELREAGIAAPVLVMGYMPPWGARLALRHDLTVTFFDVESARLFDRTAREVGGTIRAHVLIDSGMGHLGLLPDEATHFFRSLRNLEHLEIEGIYTHFSTADGDHDYTRQQIETFEGVVNPLLAAGLRFKYIHAANSAAAIHLEDARFNMVRAGIALYGLHPGPLAPVPADFKPALSWKTRVVCIKRLPAGSVVGYGNAYHTHALQQIALIPVGYADGFRRAPKRWRRVLIRGEFAPLVGPVSMNLTAVDVTNIDGVQTGDEVVLIGAQGQRAITVDDVAEWLDTNNYAVVCTILPRVPRVK
ncbi:MAG: alanine racemase, partial [Anaerolineae bacterium]|nr:alanine racemase [Anaerolineae bacterium]